MNAEEIVISITRLETEINGLKEGISRISATVRELRPFSSDINYIKAELLELKLLEQDRWNLVLKTLVGSIASLVVAGSIYLLKWG